LAVRLLVDECAEAKGLVSRLIAAGHDVLTATQANLRHARDAEIFASGVANNRIVLTSNCADFVDMHDDYIARKMPHPGIFLIYLQNERDRDMTWDRIITAIANLEATGTVLNNDCHVLNRYDW
jgi:predicted nuclease of predicted toxin-antitoxin system